MGRGGIRPGAGRKPGTPNKASVERQKAVENSGLTPLDFMLNLLRDENALMDDRKWAADKAAPFVHPKLASVEHKGDPENPVAFTRVERVIVDPSADTEDDDPDTKD